MALLAWFGGLWASFNARQPVPHATLLTDFKHLGFTTYRPSRDLLACQDRKSLAISLWELSTGHKRLELTGFTDLVFNACFSGDGRRFATPNRDGTVQVWDLGSAKELAKLRICIHDAPASILVALNATGDRLISVDLKEQWDPNAYVPASRTTTPKLWDVKTGNLLASSQRHAESVLFLPNGRAVATESFLRPALTKIWDIETGKDLCMIPGRAISLNGNAQLLADGHSLVTEDSVAPTSGMSPGADVGGTISIWDLDTGQKKSSYQTVPGIIGRPELSLDGSKLLLEYRSDAPQMRLAERLIGYEQAQKIFPDAQGVILMDLETGRTLARLPKTICSMPVFLPDGKSFAGYCH